MFGFPSNPTEFKNFNLSDYENQTDPDYFYDCNNGPVQRYQEFDDKEIAKVCKFDTRSLKQCAVPKYGYDQGKPCILLKANRVS